MDNEVKLMIQIVDPRNKARFTRHCFVALDEIAETASDMAETMSKGFREGTRKVKTAKNGASA